jgi:signal transduction histidine kinase
MTALYRQYEAALREHLKGGSRSGFKKAALLGRQAVLKGLETLDLAKIHERALLTAIAPECSAKVRTGFVKRAQVFFIEAITPIERTHLAAAAAKVHWNELSETLDERTDELAAAKRNLKRGVVQRKAAEETLKKKSEHFAKLFEESRALQETLRGLLHRVISAQENERGQISRELHDEIAQVLLGINVRLLTLQQGGSRDARKLLRDIATTQRLVEKSVKTMRRFARQVQKSL